MITPGPGLYSPGPLGDHRHADTTLFQIPLRPSPLALERSATVKPWRICPPIVGRTVVTGKQYNGVFVKSLFPEGCYDLSHLFVQVGYHGGIRSMGLSRRKIPL